MQRKLCSLSIQISSIVAVVLYNPTESIGAEEREPVQVVIEAPRKRWQLENDLRDAADNIINLYNEINTDNDYDIQCYWVQPTGTRLRERICRGEFFIEATAERAVDLFVKYQQLQRNEAQDGTGYSYETSVGVHLPVFSQQLKEAYESSTELQKAYMEYEGIQDQLESK